MHTLKLEAEVDNLQRVMDFVDKHLPADTTAKARSRIQLCAEEIFVNIASYAYEPDSGSVEIAAGWQGPDFKLTFIDRGEPFNPLMRSAPQRATTEMNKGGYGIYICRKFMDRSEYRYENGQNILTLYPFPKSLL